MSDNRSTERGSPEAAHYWQTLVALGEAVRVADDPEQLPFIVSRIIREALGVSRVGYGRIDYATAGLHVECDFTAPGVASLSGTAPLLEYCSVIDSLRRNEFIAIADVRLDPRTEAAAAALESRSARSFMNVPVLIDGQLKAVLFVNDAHVRAWQDEEMQLLQLAGQLVLNAFIRQEERRALQQSEDRYQALFGSLDSGFGIIEVDLDAPDGEGGSRIDYRVIEANPAFYRQTGLTSSILGQWRRGMEPTLEEDWYQIYGEVARSGRSARFDRKSTTSDRWFDVNAFREVDGKVAVLFSDVSARKADERQLHELNSGLDAHNRVLEKEVLDQHQERDRIWQLSNDLLGVADDQGVWLSINPAWTRTLGWAGDQIVGRTSEWMEHPDDIESTRGEIARLSAGQTTLYFENRFRTQDGEYRTLSWTAVPEGGLLYCVARDVTAAQLQAAAEAEQVAARERTWLYSPDLLSVIDMPSGRFERVNPAWSASLGWSVKEIEKRPYEDFVHHDDLASSIAAFEQVRGGSPVLRFENRYRAKDGDWHRLSWVSFPEGDKLYSSARDITAQREQEVALFDANELIAAKERAERQQRMLQNEMAHRIKNTLSMVMAIVSQTMRHAESLEGAATTIEQRIAALSSAQDLLRQTTYSSAAIRDVVRAAIRVHLQRDDLVTMKGIQLELPSQAALGLSLAIHELATNAVKYGALSIDVGHVTISWDHGADGAFRFEWRERGGPTVNSPTRRGFGSRLINQIVPSYFDGSGSTEFASDGLIYVLEGKLVQSAPEDMQPSAQPTIGLHDPHHNA